MPDTESTPDPTPAITPDSAETFASPGGHDLTADLFLPGDRKRNGAAILLVHGGGWWNGERQAFYWHASQLADLGYLAATIDYRLMPGAPFPAALLDCRSAVAWLRKQKERFQIDPDRVGAIGSSAGGHLVACLGVQDETIDGQSTRANGVVDVHGIHDFPLLEDSGWPINANWVEFLGGDSRENREAWLRASPARQVTDASAPMLVTHDPGDAIVPYEQSRILIDALVRAGRPVQFLPTPGSGHGFFYNSDNLWTQKAWPVVVAWLEQTLLNSKT